LALDTGFRRDFTAKYAHYQLRDNINGSRYHVVSKEMERLLGISGSIQRNSTPRIIIEDMYLKNLKDLLFLD